VRELSQCLATAAVLAGGAPIDAAHLPRAVVDPRGGQTCPRGPSAAPGDIPGDWPLPAGVRKPQDEALRHELVAQLTANRGNVSLAADALGKARSQVQRWLRRFEIDPASFR
jgi:transcriptional regulator of acetoin/glycerol metabolism